ncbi:UDP-glucosyltransferase 2-like [Cydia strobilella]|uniref:UDP-glucosyltransferase 2-like n=1 Tax=Cydia strobilella TaxID=1100964 RepID=UPI003003DD2A
MLAMSRLRDFVYLCALVCSSLDAARILAVFPSASISHQLPFRPLTQELARRGHEVVVITPDPAFPKGQAPKNLTEIDVHDISYATWRQFMTKVKNGKRNEVRSLYESYSEAIRLMFEQQMTVFEVKDIIKNQKDTFDLLIVEACVKHNLGFSHVIKSPVIAISSLGAVLDYYDVIGAPTHPILYPESINTRIYNLSLREKIGIYYNTFTMRNLFKKAEEKDNTVIRNIFGENTPALSELQNNIDMLFLNIHPIWEGNRPVPPSVVHIGGIHQTPEKKLPQDLQQYLDSSEHGVIYLSFGSNVDTTMLPPEKVQTIINVFSQLPYEVLWKWNQDELPGRTKNIRISKWFPQSDLLKHPKIKLFITQGGLQSTDETITAGVPVVGIPMFGDQWYNVEKYVHHGIGKQINLPDLDEETLNSAIKTVIEDKTYRANVVRLRSLMADQPMNPLERAVWWTEHVLRHGSGRHLRAPAANMSWREYYELDLVLAILSIATAAIVAVSLVLYKTVKFILGSRNRKVKRS